MHMPHWFSIFTSSRVEKFTVRELQRLHDVLLRSSGQGSGSGFSATMEKSSEEYVEALRATAEIVIWYVRCYSTCQMFGLFQAICVGNT